MKKIFTLLAAVLMAGSMMAVDVTFGNEGLAGYYYEKYALDWYLSWYGQEQSTDYRLFLERTGNVANKFGHFTTADFNIKDSFISGGGGKYAFTAVDVTLTETEYGFTIAGSVVGENGVTYNLSGEYTAPKATPSVTTFTTLSDLDGLTITLSGVAVQYAGESGNISLTDETGNIIYAVVGNYTFSNNVLTIDGFEQAQWMDPLPEEDTDLLIFSERVFNGYRNLPLCIIHYSTSPSALENTTAGVKATKLIENGQMVIIRDGKKFNAVGTKL